jgi:soluble lytic murein transglycosylase-like protein
MQALIREERALDPDARSWAGARADELLPPGPARARALGLRASSGRSSTPTPAPARLRHLRLLRELDGEVVYAFAAYNAERTGRRWLQRGRPPVDESSRRSPSTRRGHVKRLLRS